MGWYFERFWSRIFVGFVSAPSWYGAGEFIECPGAHTLL
jgi:hypothetical protein